MVNEKNLKDARTMMQEMVEERIRNSAILPTMSFAQAHNYQFALLDGISADNESSEECARQYVELADILGL